MWSELRFYDNFSEIVYVCDIETYELVYINKKGKEVFGLSENEWIGKKCYALLQNNGAACAFCNNRQLKEGEFIKWKYYNQVLEKYLVCHDTLLVRDGRNYRMEIAICDDSYVSTLGNVKQEILEKQVNDAIAVAVKKGTPDDTMACLLESIGKILKGERVYIFEKNEDGNMDNTYEWVAAGVTEEKENLQNVPADTFKVWNQGFRKEHMVVVRNLEEVRENDPPVYAYLEPQKVHSLVVVPFSLHLEMESFSSEMDIDGFLGVDNPPEEMLEHTKTLLHIMGHFILGTLKRRNLVRELQKQSYCDQQTKLGNRYALNKYIEGPRTYRKIGVVYCDVTGLKKVNDTKGHQAGDQLIASASKSLIQVFSGYGLYRLGGDEFLAICPDIEEEQLVETGQQLRQVAKANGVNFAVGTCWREGAQNIDEMMSEAEKKMYEEKRLYYQNHGIDRRKNR